MIPVFVEDFYWEQVGAFQRADAVLVELFSAELPYSCQMEVWPPLILEILFFVSVLPLVWLQPFSNDSSQSCLS